MDDEKYYRTYIVWEILSNEPTGDMSLDALVFETEEGHMSGRIISSECFETTKDAMRGLLIDQASDPSFLIREDDNELSELQ